MRTDGGKLKKTRRQITLELAGDRSEGTTKVGWTMDKSKFGTNAHGIEEEEECHYNQYRQRRP